MEHRILLPVDDSERSLEAATIVARLVKEQKEYRLVLLHCAQRPAGMETAELPTPEEVAQEWKKALENKGNAILEESRRALMDSGVPAGCIETQLRVDSKDAAEGILEAAKESKVGTIAIGRRGRGHMESLLLGSVSGKIAQYALHRSVWVIDSDITQTRKVLVAVEGIPESRALMHYCSEWLAEIPDLEYTLLHLISPEPPTFWDDGHILTPEEQRQREAQKKRWHAERVQKVEKYLLEGRDILLGRGIVPGNIKTRVQNVSEGIARDLLNEIQLNKYQMVVIGKRSFQQAKPFNLGSHANKILYGAKRVILCLVDAPTP